MHKSERRELLFYIRADTEGFAKGRLEILKDLVRDGVISVFEAAERMGMSVEEFQNDNNQRIEVESPEINR